MCQRHITRSAKSSTTLSNDHARSLKPDAQDAHQPDLACNRGTRVKEEPKLTAVDGQYVILAKKVT